MLCARVRASPVWFELPSSYVSYLVVSAGTDLAGAISTAEDSDEMVLSKLDGFSGNVAAVIVWWYELVNHYGGTYCYFKRLIID